MARQSCETLEHVGLVDRGEFFAALAGELEGDAGDADDFVAGVAHGVDGFAGLACSTSAAGRSRGRREARGRRGCRRLGHFGAKRRVVGERGVGDGGAQVGEAAELLADLQEAGFGALVGGEVVELVVADRAEEYGVRVEAGVDGGWGAACRRR